MQLVQVDDVEAFHHPTTAVVPRHRTVRAWTTKVEGYIFHIEGFVVENPHDNVELQLVTTNPQDNYDGQGFSIDASNLTRKGLKQLGEWLVHCAIALPGYE